MGDRYFERKARIGKDCPKSKPGYERFCQSSRYGVGKGGIGGLSEMSGGSYDYAYDRAEDMADRLIEYSKDPLRIAFAKHLKQVAQAMHDIEINSGK